MRGYWSRATYACDFRCSNAYTANVMNSRALGLRNKFLSLALLVVMLARALIPPGYMPVSETGLSLSIRLCSGFAAEPVREAERGRAPSAPTHDSPCPFAMVGSVAPPPAIVATVAALQPQSARPMATATARAVPTILRSQSPRGPPARA